MANKNIIRLGLLFAAFICSAIAEAGYYNVTYSGGMDPWGDSYYDEPYTGAYGTDGDYWPSMSFGGQITATFTWSPSFTGDMAPPPTVVIISENGYADESGGTATVINNGFNDPVINGASSGTHFAVINNPGTSFKRYCTPKITSSGGSYRAPCYYDIGYTALPIIPQLTLGGVTNPGQAQSILIGQRLQAVLSFSLTSGLPSLSYAWSIVGGAPFSQYQASNSLSTLTPWTSPASTNTFLYFAQPATAATISVVGTIATSQGGASFTLTQSVAVDAPTMTAMTSTEGIMDLLDSSTNPQVNHENPANFWLWDATDTISKPGTTYTGGIFYQSAVTTPSKYISGTSGQWGWAQLATGTADTMVDTDGNNWVADSNSIAFPVLDTSFPYGSSFWQGNGVGTRYQSDAPGFSSSVAETQKIVISKSFNIIQMYQPPGGNVCYVPLQSAAWTCGGTAIKGSPDWSISNVPATWGAVTKYPDFPIWSDNMSNHTSYSEK